MKKAILSFLCTISATMAMAQANPKSGYIITNNGDTIRGIIDFRTNERLSTQCDFWANGETEGKNYKPGEIEGFRFDDNGKYFVTRRLNVTGEPELYFAEYIVQGKMNLYCVVYGQNDIFFFEREDGEMAQLSSKVFSYTSDYNAIEKYKSIQQEKQEQYGKVKLLLKDSGTAVVDMDDEYITRKKLVNVVRDYHNDVCTDGSKCVVYEYNGKSDKTAIYFKAFAGYTYYATDKPDSQYELDKNYSTNAYEIGIGIELDLKRVAKNFSAEFGLTYIPEYKSTISFPDMNYNVYTIESTYKRSAIALSGGVVKGFGNGKIKPLIRGGVYLAIKSGETDYYKYHQEYKKKQQKFETEQFTAFDTGIYLGAGAQMSLGKNILRLHADWNQTIKTKFGQTKWGLTAEFIL